MDNTSKYIGLDFETYSDVDLMKHGADRYFDSPNFRVLIGASYHEDGAGSATRGTYDFVLNAHAKKNLERQLIGRIIVAHNADFERRCLEKLGIVHPHDMFRDSAVIARVSGAGGSLEAAAPQLLNVDKLEAGKALIMLFSVPGRFQEVHGSGGFDDQIVDMHVTDWDLFHQYCGVDAELSYKIAISYYDFMMGNEAFYEQVTSAMNQEGWFVDQATVAQMRVIYEANKVVQLARFRELHDSDEVRSYFDPVKDEIITREPLNFNSSIQLKKWCEDRGVKAKSFDEKSVADLIPRLKKKLESIDSSLLIYSSYEAVLAMLETKQALGGSSLKKLETLENTVGNDGYLRGQYLHAGAGQTLRTSGRSVQMQNLKRLGGDIADMSTLFTNPEDWDNAKLAANLRQVFTSSRPDGQLIVGDFSSVESRGLAYLAGAEWKLDAFRGGKDMYKVLASKIYSISYNAVEKPQRQTGKVGELSCGYGAGANAVYDFAKNMGVDMSEQEAGDLVKDWRAANPEVVDLWAKLDEMLQLALTAHDAWHNLTPRLQLCVRSIPVPASLQDQVGKTTKMKSLQMVVYLDGEGFLLRVFHGCHQRGRNVCYFKPSGRKTGDLWSNHFMDPKTKQIKFYSIYGGKLSGILTQSFCRELFFQSMAKIYTWVEKVPNVRLIGQFHDEIVLDWWPDPFGISLHDAKAVLTKYMSDSGEIEGFPLEAEIKSDYRYTK